MNQSEADKLIAVIRECVRAQPEVLQGATDRVIQIQPASNPNGGGKASFSAEAAEELYQHIKNRLIEECRVDPVLLHLLTTRPELVVEVEPRTVTVDGTTLKGRVARLMAQGWFANPRAVSACRKELARTGADPGGGGGLSDCLAAYTRDGFLVREGDGYQLAPAVAVSEKHIKTL